MKVKFACLFLLPMVLFIACEQPGLNLDLVAYGTIQSDGTIRKSSGNFTLTKSIAAAGTYTLDWVGDLTTNIYESIITVTPISVSDRSAVVMSMSGGTLLQIQLYSQAGTLIDTDFSFSVYK
jgi:hypothetical protein